MAQDFFEIGIQVQEQQLPRIFDELKVRFWGAGSWNIEAIRDTVNRICDEIVTSQFYKRYSTAHSLAGRNEAELAAIRLSILRLQDEKRRLDAGEAVYNPPNIFLNDCVGLSFLLTFTRLWEQEVQAAA